MFIYEYQCLDCGYELEVIQKMSDFVFIDCLECKGNGFKKCIFVLGFCFFGLGWYEIDFKIGKKKNLVKQDSDFGSVVKLDLKKFVVSFIFSVS